MTELMAACGSKLLGAVGCAHLQTQAPATCLASTLHFQPPDSRAESAVLLPPQTWLLLVLLENLEPVITHTQLLSSVSKHFSLIMVIYFQNTIRSNPSPGSVWTFESLRGGGCDPESPSSHSWHSEPLLINALGSQVVQPFSYCKLL